LAIFVIVIVNVNHTASHQHHNEVPTQPTHSVTAAICI